MTASETLKALDFSKLQTSFVDELGKLESWKDANPKERIVQLLKVIECAEKEIEKNGSASAFSWYGENLIHGTYNFPIDIERGLELLQCAMGMGEYNSLTTLANVYSLSLPHIQDEKYDNMTKALHYYKKSSELNDGYASYRAALCYYEGHGVKKDISKAIEYAEIAKRQGSCIYGEMLWATWLMEGVILDNDNDEAYRLLFSCYGYLEQEEDNLPEWLRATIKYKLGWCIFYGSGVEQDRETGFSYISVAAAEGDVEAIHWMKDYQDHINICGKFF